MISRSQFGNFELPAPSYMDGTFDGERTIRAGETIKTSRFHYANHVRRRGEWPEGTSFEEYLASIEQAVDSSDSVIFSGGRFSDDLKVYVMRRSGGFRGRREVNWIFVVYDVQRGSWVTAYQRPESPEEVFQALREQAPTRITRDSFGWLTEVPKPPSEE